MSLFLYFVVASIVKTSLFRPYLLTRQFVVLSSAAGLTFCRGFPFRCIGDVFGAKGSSKGLALGWGYSLLPTAAWFWMTSLLYVLTPPPRTTSVPGMIFSVISDHLSNTPILESNTFVSGSSVWTSVGFGENYIGMCRSTAYIGIL